MINTDISWLHLAILALLLSSNLVVECSKQPSESKNGSRKLLLEANYYIGSDRNLQESSPSSPINNNGPLMQPDNHHCKDPQTWNGQHPPPRSSDLKGYCSWKIWCWNPQNNSKFECPPLAHMICISWFAWNSQYCEMSSSVCKHSISFRSGDVYALFGCSCYMYATYNAILFCVLINYYKIFIKIIATNIMAWYISFIRFVTSKW